VTRRCRTRRAQCRACHDVALHREEEFKLHVRPALCNGVTAEELRALLIQAAVYAGVPAANAAFRWVKEALGADLK
jgi:3-oxoadipate enol-lactonase / 4-carboxymuconolactone decarboxylase